MRSVLACKAQILPKLFGGFMKNLKEARKTAGLTQTELAEKIGCTQKDVSRWENGKHNPSLEIAEKLARALGRTIEDLF